MRYHYDDDAQHVSGSAAMLTGYASFLGKYWSRIVAEGPEAVAEHCFRLGRTHARLGTRRAAWRYFLRAARTHRSFTRRGLLHAGALLLGRSGYDAVLALRNRFAGLDAAARRAEAAARSLPPPAPH